MLGGKPKCACRPAARTSACWPSASRACTTTPSPPPAAHLRAPAAVQLQAARAARLARLAPPHLILHVHPRLPANLAQPLGGPRAKGLRGAAGCRRQALLLQLLRSCPPARASSIPRAQQGQAPAPHRPDAPARPPARPAGRRKGPRWAARRSRSARRPPEATTWARGSPRARPRCLRGSRGSASRRGWQPVVHCAAGFDRYLSGPAWKQTAWKQPAETPPQQAAHPRTAGGRPPE